MRAVQVPVDSLRPDGTRLDCARGGQCFWIPYGGGIGARGRPQSPLSCAHYSSADHETQQELDSVLEG